MNVMEYPKPIIIDGLRQLHPHRDTAGTKECCIFCGRETYRFVGNKAVCSFCSEKHKDANVGPSWHTSIICKNPDSETAFDSER